MLINNLSEREYLTRYEVMQLVSNLNKLDVHKFMTILEVVRPEQKLYKTRLILDTVKYTRRIQDE
ncbi:hypothetical protein HMPREF3188_00677 [Tissierellia bacterium KA00581]|nr:hypothetical protein HMPREF3188_00677 [Tissierellia bacterium KA00581]